ncbi:PhzF family phenazine biosynthesis protein [bacterium]|nr:PhzF family phenazine biosynthesis protein [bacterium]MBU1675563.1 PhzF family phenazine biosynthesis protein [bacterium]
MVERDYMLMDVFTRVPFGGSRLTLFPEGGGLSAKVMQIIASEMGTPETAFVTGADAAARQARLRIFTPSAEVPLSGLSVVGATCALFTRGLIARSQPETTFTWQTETGFHPVTLKWENGDTLFSMAHEPAEFIGQYYQRGKVARALGLDEQDIAITGMPCEIVSAGLPIHIVPLASLDTMRSIKLSAAGAREIMNDLGFGDLFVFTCETESRDADVHCRMFAHGFGIPEDAATGSAVGSLIAYMIKHRLVPAGAEARIVCEQGLEMGRPSRLFVQADVEDGKAVAIRVGGHCVNIGEGRISFDTEQMT